MIKYTLYVANETIDLEHNLARRFGGLTATRGRGLWSDGEKWYDEGVNVLVVFVDGSEGVRPTVFDSFVADFTSERAYVLESKGEGEIRFVR